mmetsp:Transcript_47897/g.159638  ORF Transcript_47897/g.159638 Transcript_47897/m.159638 type:complete len:372 (-) Transcript_47897:73-1188(-)
MSSVLRAAAAAAGSASVLTLLRKAEEYPIAFHEAGHSVVASHLEFCGLDARTATGERHRGRLRIEAPSLVRFATIVPRVTAAGEYVGETKLTVRWRHMAAHTDWEPGTGAGGEGSEAQAASSDGPAASSGGPTPPILDLRAVSHEGDPAAQVLLAARLAYLLGGRAAEDRLYGCGAGEAARSRVAELAASPGRASGDLRQIRRLLGGSAEGPHATAAYAYATEVLSLRWPQATCARAHTHTRARARARCALRLQLGSNPAASRQPQVQALAGALLVLGTVDGSQAAALLSKQRACGAAGEVEAREAALAGESGPLVWVRGWPLLFGCVWAASLPAETRRRSRRHPREGEPPKKVPQEAVPPVPAASLPGGG